MNTGAYLVDSDHVIVKLFIITIFRMQHFTPFPFDLRTTGIRYVCTYRNYVKSTHVARSVCVYAQVMYVTEQTWPNATAAGLINIQNHMLSEKDIASM